MGTRIEDQDDFGERRKKYPAVKVRCVHPVHSEPIEFLIPAGRKTAKCPKCGLRAERK